MNRRVVVTDLRHDVVETLPDQGGRVVLRRGQDGLAGEVDEPGMLKAAYNKSGSDPSLKIFSGNRQAEAIDAASWLLQ